MVRQFARLMLLFDGGAGHFSSLQQSPFGTETLEHTLSGRPVGRDAWHSLAALETLWFEKAHLTLRGTTKWPGRAALVLVTLVALACTIWTVTTVPVAYADEQQQMQLVNDLLKLKLTRVYLEYWTCYRLLFQSQEQDSLCVSALPPDYMR